MLEECHATDVIHSKAIHPAPLSYLSHASFMQKNSIDHSMTIKPIIPLMIIRIELFMRVGLEVL
jgi:hypothetical protein